MLASRRSSPAQRSLVSLSVSLLALVPGLASAYTVEAPIGPGCHEQITSEALRRVRANAEAAPAYTGSRNERALIDDVQFNLASDMKDLGAATLLIGARDNDLKGLSVDDLRAMAEVHGNPRAQAEHCLRGPGQGEPGGTEAALRDCRAFIRARVLEALDGLGQDGEPDMSARTTLRLRLSLRGQMDAPLPTYYVRMGQAVHTLEDSFSHAFRTPDGLQITELLDWLHVVDGTFVESRDGPGHAADLDACEALDTLRAARLELATVASTELLTATLGAGRSRDQKMADVDVVLDRYMGYSPGCTFDNGWCDAAERQYPADSSGCAAAGGGASSGSSAALALMALVGLALLRRSRRPRTLTGLVTLLAIAGVLAPGLARADEPIPPPVTVPVPEPGPTNPSETAWGAYLGVFGSVSNAAVGTQLGLRLRVSRHWTFGIDAEWNPWLAFNGPTPFRRGAANAYSTVILRFPLAYESFNLITTANLGVSVLLDTLYGAPSGSMGIFLGVSPLGLEWKLSHNLLLILNPLGFALPVPKVTGVPLWYPQYRFSIGLAVVAG